MRRTAKVMFLLTLTFGTVFSVLANAQIASESQASKQESISPAKLRAYLRQQGGIEKLSAEVGDVALNDTDEQWGEHNLNSLTKASDVIVVAKIESSSSHLIDSGDSISTEYNLQLRETLKGSPARDIKVTARGGKVILTNGHSATIHTALWDGLTTGNEYIFFLKNSGDSFEPVGYSLGVLQLNDADDSVHVLSTVARDRNIVSEISGSSIASVENEIHNSSLPN